MGWKIPPTQHYPEKLDYSPALYHGQDAASGFATPGGASWPRAPRTGVKLTRTIRVVPY
jgi:hypothetical protein